MRKTSRNVAIATHCNLRQPNAAPVILCFNSYVRYPVWNAYVPVLWCFRCWYLTIRCDVDVSPRIPQPRRGLVRTKFDWRRRQTFPAPVGTWQVWTYAYTKDNSRFST